MHTLPPPQPVAHSVTCTSCHFLHLYRNIKGFMVQTGDPTGERWACPAAGVGWYTCVCPTAQGRGRAVRASGETGLRMSSTTHSRYAVRSVPAEQGETVRCHPVQHTGRGIVSMANSGADSNGSQFFITYSRQAHLDSKYTVFGRYAARIAAPCQ